MVAINDTDSAVELLASLDEEDPQVRAVTLLAEHIVRVSPAYKLMPLTNKSPRAPLKAS